MTDRQFKGITFQELISDQGPLLLDKLFLKFLEDKGDLVDHLKSYQSSGQYCSNQVLLLAPYIETFIADLFKIKDQVKALQNSVLKHHPIAVLKKEVVLKISRRLLRTLDQLPPFDELNAWFNDCFHSNVEDLELYVAETVQSWLDQNDTDKIEKISQWLAYQLSFCQLDWVSLKLPDRVDAESWVESIREGDYLKSASKRLRQGFALTDQRMDMKEVADHVNYCVYCHSKQGDFCRSGFPVKKQNPQLGLKKDPFNRVLTGCPLDEKISEMNVLRKEGFSIGALAVIMIDNPMCAATGHRICNDCMKACIYQKQDPVNIPQIETRILTDVLSLPFGVEIYLLLMRWLPIRLSQPIPKPNNHQKVCVMGMGPAGFTLAYHLLMEGCTVVGMDGLKIEPLPKKWLQNPVFQSESLWKALDQRPILGFGGVAEYGITSRWDKNFLSLIYLSLVRWNQFRVFGGVRFGGTMNLDDIQNLGFDHLSLAVGAGLPKALDIPGSMAPGMMQANDFLMNLQLTGAVRKDSMVPLEVNLPAVVIGGGLTGVDTATEVQAYYVEMVIRVYRRFKSMNLDVEDFLERFNQKHRKNIRQWIQHGQTLMGCYNDTEKMQKHLLEWGGVTIVYRKRMQDSPAYRLNAEELEEALKEGIRYLENHSPKSVGLDSFHNIESITLEHSITSQTFNMPVRSVLVATGAKPNVAYSFEYYGTFEKENGYYQPFKLEGDQLAPMESKQHCKENEIGVFTSFSNQNFKVSFIGDAHPVYHGSVVKAIASAKNHYADIVSSLPESLPPHDGFLPYLDQLFNIKVIENTCFSESLRRVRCQVPLAKDRFKPGQFYRIQTLDQDLQNDAFEALSAWVLDVQDESATLDFLIPQTTLAEKKVQDWKKDQNISIMGPTGVRLKIPKEPTKVLLMADSLSAYKLMHVAKSMKEYSHEVFVIVCGYLESEVYAFLVSQVNALYLFETTNEAIDFIQEWEHSSKIQSVYLCGKGDSIKTMGQHQHLLRQSFAKDCDIKASVHGPMQCMLKGICAQCLQWQINPNTGQRTKAVFACSWQDQPIELVDWDHYGQRLSQGSSLESFNQTYRKWALSQ